MSRPIKLFSIHLMLGGSLVFGLSILQANEVKEIKVSKHTFSAFEKWEQSFAESEPKGKVPLLRDKAQFISPLIPGMSSHTQLLDPAIRNLLVAQITNESFGLTKKDPTMQIQEQLKARWVMAENRLISVPSDFEPHQKLARFLRSISQLGREEFEYMKKIEKKQGQLESKADALNFFFMSDALRLEYLNSVASQSDGDTLPGKLAKAFKHQPKFKKLNGRFRNDDQRQEFSKWMVEKVYKPILESENGEQKIRTMATAMADKKSGVSNSTIIRKIKEKFENVELSIQDVANILTFLLDES